MPDIKLKREWCKGCGLCIEICPKGVYDREHSISPRGMKEIKISSPQLCNNCLLCELLCPELAITVPKKTKNAKVED